MTFILPFASPQWRWTVWHSNHACRCSTLHLEKLLKTFVGIGDGRLLSCLGSGPRSSLDKKFPSLFCEKVELSGKNQWTVIAGRFDKEKPFRDAPPWEGVKHQCPMHLLTRHVCVKEGWRSRISSQTSGCMQSEMCLHIRLSRCT